MAQSIVVRDLTKLVRDVGLDIDVPTYLEHQKSSDIFIKLKLQQKEFSDAVQALIEIDDSLKEYLYRYNMDQNGILDQINNILTKDSEEEQNKILETLIKNNNISDVLKGKIIDYIDKYNEVYQRQIDSIATIDDIGETIRGDKSLYTIGLGSKSSLREAILTTQEMQNFMKQKDKFELVRNGNNSYTFALRQNLTKTKMAEGLSLAKGQSLEGKEALKFFETTDSTRNLIWKELQSATIHSNKGSIITSARKYEMLNSGIWDKVYQISDSKEQKNLIQDIINKKLDNSFVLENTFFGARGDNLIREMKEDGTIQNYSLSQKYFSRKGVSIADSNSILNALSFWSDRESLEKLSQESFITAFNNGYLDNADQITYNLLNYQETTDDYLIQEVQQQIDQIYS